MKLDNVAEEALNRMLNLGSGADGGISYIAFREQIVRAEHTPELKEWLDKFFTELNGLLKLSGAPNTL